MTAPRPTPEAVARAVEALEQSIATNERQRPALDAVLLATKYARIILAALRSHEADVKEAVAATWAHANEDEHDRATCPICANESVLDNLPGVNVTKLAAGDGDFMPPAIRARRLSQGNSERGGEDAERT